MPGIMLEANVAPSKKHDFEKQYRAKAGRMPRHPFYTVYRNKWGIECRVYFDSEPLKAVLMALQYNVEKVRSETRWGMYKYRVNSQELFWKLVEAGLRLGHNRM